MISDHDSLRKWIQRASATADSLERRSLLESFRVDLSLFLKARSVLLDSVYLSDPALSELKMDLELRLQDIQTCLWLAEETQDSEDFLSRADLLAASIESELSLEDQISRSQIPEWKKLVADSYELLPTLAA